MLRMNEGCVDCPPELGCNCETCSQIHSYWACDLCDSAAQYRFDGHDYCRRCIEDILLNEFYDLSISEKAEMMNIELEELEEFEC